MASLDVKSYPGGRLGIARCAATGAVLFAVAMVACWIAAVIGWPAAPHWLLTMFGDAPATSFTALGFGLVCAAVTGAIAGALVAAVYNLFGFMASR